MGVSGTGKSTVGIKLSQMLEIPFLEGDDLHSVANKNKMRAGIPLIDEDRLPWLAGLREINNQSRKNLVLSCSALRRSYRDILTDHKNRTFFVHLHAPYHIIEERLSLRKDHFFNPQLLKNQFESLELLEKKETGIQINVDRSIDLVVAEISRSLNHLLV
tara:strand:+ start:3032 stop:3511 length:480 start_codon:yes stop_codon:yes gene_type:complete